MNTCLQNRVVQTNNLVNKLAAGPPIKYYVDLKEKLFLRNTETLGKAYNVIQSNIIWKITKESKKIGNYKCFKAIATYQEYNPITKANNTFNPVAWFTPEIPVSFGPSKPCCDCIQSTGYMFY